MKRLTLTDLNKLPEANINVTASDLRKEGNKCMITVTIENPGTGLAFAVKSKNT